MVAAGSWRLRRLFAPVLYGVDTVRYFAERLVVMQRDLRAAVHPVDAHRAPHLHLRRARDRRAVAHDGAPEVGVVPEADRSGTGHIDLQVARPAGAVRRTRVVEVVDA